MTTAKQPTDAKKKSREPKRYRLTDRQCRLYLNDMQEFGYTNLTFEEVRAIADLVADGKPNRNDPVAIHLCDTLDGVDRDRTGAHKSPLAESRS
jgi:hypothetical protein